MEKKVKQPRINIGLVGHIDHGKTTLLKALSGKWADTHSEELRRGISIKLGYANVVVRKCGDCGEPECYTTKKECPVCGTETEVVKRLSFIDAPGHETLMATMLSGAATIDAAVLVVAADESCPQPQTQEHLRGLEALGVEDVIVVQNKIDLVTEEEAKENYKQIKEFLKGSVAEDAPIIPVSAQQGINIDVLLKALDDNFKVPEQDLEADPIFLVVRSFDINKPGTKAENMKGGILGGILKQGTLSVGEEVVIKPGRRTKEGDWVPIRTEITSMMAGEQPVEEAKPGGSIGIGTTLDPFFTKSDKLVGSVVGKEGRIPETKEVLDLETHLFDRVIGTKDKVEVKDLKHNERVMINAWTARTVGRIVKEGEDSCSVGLKVPVCIEEGNKVAISRQVRNRWRLIGYGIVK